MPNWLTPALKWGGIALAVVFAIAVIYMETIAPGADPQTLLTTGL